MSNTEVIQTLYAAFGRGDIPAIQNLVTDDVNWDNTRVASAECPWNGNFSGESSLPGFFAAVGGELDLTVFDPHTFTETGGNVTVQLHIKGTIRKNGAPFVNDAVHVWRLNPAGKVNFYRHYNDTAMELAAWRA